ncbi:galactose-specific lectin nattectin-like [Hippocampus comes]|uniref:galactose-specific lectin nattectin-like n=1 Tax=Hippocampus comes TaxID=109280 RepID=UPI00094E9F3A|nr:PREDICTED: galactose-specific lectin nattectin-like [Hippocampus comes]
MEFALRSLFLLCGISGLLTGVWSKPTVIVKGNSCPIGWTQLDCYCYIYEDEGRSFADAESVCNILGGNLVSIHSALENAFILELIRAGDNDDEAWIGLHDAIQNDDFVWTDGSDTEFTNFDVGGSEPDETGECVHIDESAGLWEDALCSDEAPYVCIRDILHH